MAIDLANVIDTKNLMNQLAEGAKAEAKEALQEYKPQLRQAAIYGGIAYGLIILLLLIILYKIK